MARRPRILANVIVAALVLLHATPTLPRLAAPRVTTGRCEIAASLPPVELLAIPAERAAAPVDATCFERAALGAFTLVSAARETADARAAAARLRDVHRPTGATWVRALQQRARSPGDPDPLCPPVRR